ncbi:hypothetical protein [Chitinophaga sp. S165]|uniref:hypothetical protein n=1 Tax=Chitinophaga sp. S165 TaxID=2135462 RepID=UPI000D9C76FE|nr:hypothetical protein [Chitinophaga sp. S165]PWV51466.1 hypothetical protein C7475_10375 [Chitinophaga sp. S165]
MSLIQKKQHYLHALHNEHACDYLDSSNLYLDWVITTSFYAALHHVSAVIFPLRHKFRGEAKTVNDIGMYRDLIKSKENKHAVMTKLVFSNCQGIGHSYKALLELSYAARYEPTFQAYLYADKAKRYLAAIKAHCADASQQNEMAANIQNDRQQKGY